MNDLVNFENTDKQLNRSLGFGSLLFLSMGAIIGSGWLLGPLDADSLAGPASVISWAVGGVLVLLVAFNYAEIAGMMPRSGAIVRYPHLTHGGYTGFILGWAYLLAAVTVPAIEAEAVLTYAASNYLKSWHLTASRGGTIVLTWPRGIVAGIVLMAAFFALNYFGVRLTGTLNGIITWWKLIIPSLTFIGLFIWAFHGSNFTSAASGGFTPLGIKSIFYAIPAGGVIFSYLGFRQALDFGGEAKDPQKHIPRATIVSVILGGAIFILLQLSFTGGINWASIGLHPGQWAKLTGASIASSPFYDLLKATGIGALGFLGTLLLYDAMISPGGTGYIYNGTAARTVFGLSVDGYLPPKTQSLNGRFRVPWIALVAATVMSCIFFFPAPSWYGFVGFISSATVLTYVMGGVALQVLRRTAPDLKRPYRLRWSWFMSPLGFLAATMIVYWSGYATLANVVAAEFVALPIFTWFFAIKRGWLKPAVAGTIGGLFLVAWIATQYYGHWVLASSTLPLSAHPSFPLLFGLQLAEVVVFTLLIYAFGTPAARRAVNASWWFLFLVFAMLALSYYGGFGPLSVPDIKFPIDTLPALGIGLVAFYWGVFSGFKTEELDAILARGDGLVPAAEAAPKEVSAQA